MFERLWAYPLHHAVGAFLVDGDDCFFAARSTRLLSVDVRTGECRWSVRIGNPYGWIAVNERAAFYQNQHAHLIAVDRSSGEFLWSRDLQGINGWLHASTERVIVGGWRGYTDILALDANDGTTCWSRGARRSRIHSTRIHAESGTLVVAEPQYERIAFVRLADGQQVGEYATDAWGSEFSERPTGTSRSGVPLILECGERELFVISGPNPAVTSVSLPVSIWSKNLACEGQVVPFMTPTGELAAWHLVEHRLLRFGPLEHKRRDILPFCEAADGTYAVGTSTGELRLLGQSGELMARTRIGKRVATRLTRSGPVLVCGTDSGEAVAVAIRNDGAGQ